MRKVGASYDFSAVFTKVVQLDRCLNLRTLFYGLRIKQDIAAMAALAENDGVGHALEASATGDASRIRELFSQPGSPDPNFVKDDGGYTLLVIAAEHGHVERDLGDEVLVVGVTSGPRAHVAYGGNGVVKNCDARFAEYLPPREYGS